MMSSAGSVLGNDISLSELDATLEGLVSSGSVFFCPIKPQSVTQGTWTIWAQTNSPCNMGFGNTTIANGDSCTFKIQLAAGTYTVQVHHYRQNADGGRADIYLGATKIVSGIEFYSNPTTFLICTETTGVVVATAGLYSLTITMNGKDAASAGYAAGINAIHFVRTA